MDSLLYNLTYQILSSNHTSFVSSFLTKNSSNLLASSVFSNWIFKISLSVTIFSSFLCERIAQSLIFYYLFKKCSIFTLGTNIAWYKVTFVASERKIRYNILESPSFYFYKLAIIFPSLVAPPPFLNLATLNSPNLVVFSS